VADEDGSEVPIVWRGRRARAFVPALLADRDLSLDIPTAQRTATAVADLSHSAAAMPVDYAPLARLLLRAEGIASSFIEGVAAPVVDVVLAERMGPTSPTPASWVAANLAAVDQAFAEAGALTVDSLCRWHRTLMAGSPTPARYVGALREEQGWIGGTSPLDAHLVTPPADRLPALLDDLNAYANRTDVDPVAQAAVAHAQFEVIHPFADGNGRIGRVLIAWVLTRRLSLVTPPPISTRIAADVGGYAAGLTLFRLGEHEHWIRWFADAVSGAGAAQQALVAQVERLRAEWQKRLSAPRAGRALRADSSAWRILDLLPRHLVLTAQAVTTELAQTEKAARSGLRALVDAGVLTEHSTARQGAVGRPRTLYVSPELLALTGSTPLRDRIGVRPGEVEVQLDGAGLHLEPIAGDGLVEQSGRLVVAPSGDPLTDADVTALRDAGRR